MRQLKLATGGSTAIKYARAISNFPSLTAVDKQRGDTDGRPPSKV